MGKYHPVLMVWWPKFWIRSDRFHIRRGALLVWYFLFGFQIPPGIDCIVIRLISKKQHFSSIQFLVRPYAWNLLKICIYLKTDRHTDCPWIPAFLVVCFPVSWGFSTSSSWWANLVARVFGENFVSLSCGTAAYGSGRERFWFIVSQSFSRYFPKKLNFVSFNRKQILLMKVLWRIIKLAYQILIADILWRMFLVWVHTQRKAIPIEFIMVMTGLFDAWFKQLEMTLFHKFKVP